VTASGTADGVAAELTQEDISWARTAVVETMIRRQRTGEPVPPQFPSLLRRLDDILTSKAGSADGTSDGDGPSHLDLIGTAEAAAIIGTSEEWTRRIARQLGAYRVGGQWVFRRADVIEHNLGGKTA
jgi:hypothetical protein